MTTTSLPSPFVYVESDLLEGQTLVEWRRANAVPRRRLRDRLLRGRS